ncbi:carbamoyltransferase HypF [uncultured Cohaesibacter sp.]|uniref:carbamoyltransferase HypF n=1 Tax=uncultured Cohaesibacter sp. TaxID=1002546 RepID=UPI0029C62917|nr:carbamoyltransferase HypF [uncultured Cohaesibacter sp.]
MDSAEHNQDAGDVVGWRVRARGLVQGVGFRPTVWQLATELGLEGDVINDGSGVLIQLWGTEPLLETFFTRLQKDHPPLARIDTLAIEPLHLPSPHTGFVIGKSTSGAIETSIVPDAATCPDCLRETMDPHDRRHGYPFTNCTHCGPRLSIIKALPYDRSATSMADFEMCPKCRAEYEDPANRRFHAQPNACPDCGPQVTLLDASGEPLAIASGDTVLSQCATLLKGGSIVAIKGIGGFHLACDATNEEAVNRLRERKRRYGKPFALMAKSVEVIGIYCEVDAKARAILEGKEAPILLLDRRVDAPPLPDAIAPGLNRLGFMVPYTPLHHVLLNLLDHPLVMTSGNLSHNPQITDNEQALKDLSSLADAFLIHDRDIVNRLDDSVVQMVGGEIQVIRRARGYAPEPLLLPKGFEEAPTIFAAGAEIKNSFCLLRKGEALVSHHIGDMENPSVQSDYRQVVRLYTSIREFEPQVVARDMHEGYFASRVGLELASLWQREAMAVQHHHAHVAAVMAEHQLPLDHAPVLGVVFDGLGAGDDGKMWGGEFLLADYRGFQQLGHIDSIPMPGGDRCSVEPWRNSFAHLQQALGWDHVATAYPGLEFVRWMSEQPIRQLATMMERGLNAPLASSTGRLFDAVAGVLGICRERQLYEGEAATRLQVLAENRALDTVPLSAYPFDTESDGDRQVILWKRMWMELLDDLASDTSHSDIAIKFHQTLIRATTEVIVRLTETHQFKTIVLSGGVFQNHLLLKGVSSKLQSEGFEVLSPRFYPANDGGISLGQVVICAARALAEQ